MAHYMVVEHGKHGYGTYACYHVAYVKSQMTFSDVIAGRG